MTLPQLFHALINALRTQPESDTVDQLLADLAARSAAQLHDTGATRLKLACLQVTNPEPFIAADKLLRHYGFAITTTRHQAAHLISIKRLTVPAADPYAITKGAQAA